ncbi:hypothetical protein Taro_009236 [Colocasia esculenta]|uniref:Uncharacterized protein n=1 Tax=Colocasia esculenta TaxID=4460 RepID=A0A843U568_COLES|nr:hypothetical protein [Colocasia esculenta]
MHIPVADLEADVDGEAVPAVLYVLCLNPRTSPSPARQSPSRHRPDLASTVARQSQRRSHPTLAADALANRRPPHSSQNEVKGIYVYVYMYGIYLYVIIYIYTQIPGFPFAAPNPQNIPHFPGVQSPKSPWFPPSPWYPLLLAHPPPPRVRTFLPLLLPLPPCRGHRLGGLRWPWAAKALGGMRRPWAFEMRDRLDEMEQSMIYNGYFCPTFTCLKDAGTEEPNHFSFGGYICETVDIAQLGSARCHLGLGRAWA